MLKIILVIIALAAISFFVFHKSQPKLDILSEIQKIGFPEASFSSSTNINLDKDGFSTLTDVSTSKGRSISIKSANLIGELSQNGAITIAGWNKTTSNLPNANIFDAEINLSTPLGIVLIKGAANISDSGIEAILKANQSNVSFNARLKTEIFDNGRSVTSVEFDRGRIITENIRVSRLSGTIKADIEGTFIEFSAGGASVYGLPFKSIAGTLENGKLSLQAKALGAREIELSIDNGKASIYAPDESVLKNWLEQNNLEKLPKEFEVE